MFVEFSVDSCRTSSDHDVDRSDLGLDKLRDGRTGDGELELQDTLRRRPRAYNW
ncbi:hypothetical protein EXIGLDRAFT_716954 [Exidia glandulosa HHB12029]|uniref:Uncharacterized protein n=1 Tax=Exidia glandulosa HHB12029 TaxID=1314781 RepID=A0A165ILW9_EXIGL|nr:hypothetical protein EXIGLDRAFT_722499 [Exidia glandulosa HHB12029]KZV93585.1 hypothetical protein EXIGLDRAFT_716954 [Exidia glandulosa HHB12029]